MKRYFTCLLFAAVVSRAAASPEVVPPWPEGVPGGGYVGLAVDHEGTDDARALNDMGVTAFVSTRTHRGRPGQGQRSS
jgi:hypothetical protein